MKKLHLFENLYIVIKIWLTSKFTIISILIYKLIPAKKELLISNKTDIVIEGFPRSANTFAVEAFLHPQNRDIKIAHHIHLPFQIIYACKKNIPTLVVIRNPLDAISSYLVYNQNINIRNAIKYYIKMYEYIYKYKDKFVIAPFEFILKYYDKIINEVNNKYNTNFNEFFNTVDNNQLILIQIEKIVKNMQNNRKFNLDKIPIPSEYRKQKTTIYKNKIEKEHKDLLTRANEIYYKYLDYSKIH